MGWIQKKAKLLEKQSLQAEINGGTRGTQHLKVSAQVSRHRLPTPRRTSASASASEPHGPDGRGRRKIMLPQRRGSGGGAEAHVLPASRGVVIDRSQQSPAPRPAAICFPQGQDTHRLHHQRTQRCFHPADSCEKVPPCGSSQALLLRRAMFDIHSTTVGIAVP